MGAHQSAAADKALRLVQRGISIREAAKRTGLALSTIYRALKRQQEKK